MRIRIYLLLVNVIKIYRKLISPLFPQSCIFTPTCSRYAETALTRYGAIRGGWLTVLRILRCHPFKKGGYDPVPDKWENRR